MGKIVTPKKNATVNGRTPTVDEYVQDYLTRMRAPLKKRTVFGQAGRAVVRESGECTLYAPDGTPIKVVELPEGGTQIEHGDHLHAVVRPGVVNLTPATS